MFLFLFRAKDFVDCIDRIRFLSWLMIGSLTHAAITRNEGTIICHPIPVDASQSIADYILYIITGFADQSKTSVIHMSSLFHSFILCQVKTHKRRKRSNRCLFSSLFSYGRCIVNKLIEVTTQKL